MVSEGDVAGELAMSRTPVREAFLRLAAEGWLRLFPKRGALVVPVAPGEAEAVVDARLLLESHAVDLVATGPDDGRRARLVAGKMRDMPLVAALYEAALEVDSEAPRAIRELKRLFYSQKRWVDLVKLLSQDAARTEDREAQALMLYQAARIQGDRLGNTDAAIPLLERAHAASPEDAMILDELARHYELAGHWEALVSSLERLAAKATAPSDRLHRLHRLGIIYRDRLHNDELAIQR